MSKIRLTYEYIKEQIEEEKYTLLSNEYINSHTYLLVQCDKGHEYKITWNKWQQGRRCLLCSIDNKKHKFKYVKEQIEKVKGYKLLSKEYINSDTKIDVQCDKNHVYKVEYNHFQQGQRCPYCNGNVYKKHSYDYIKEQIKKEGYRLLSKSYINNNTKLKIQCNKGHIYKSNYNNFQQKNSRCPVCYAEKQSSLPEEEIQKYLKKLNINFISNDRTQILNPKTGYKLELDIWMPESNKAIEFNGEYWHSLEEVKIRDIERLKQCEEKGIDLLVIQEQDWLNNKSEVIKQIKNWIDE